MRCTADAERALTQVRRRVVRIVRVVRGRAGRRGRAVRSERRAAGPVSVEVAALQRLALLAQRGVLAVVRAAQRVRAAQSAARARARAAAQRRRPRHARPADRELTKCASFGSTALLLLIMLIQRTDVFGISA